MGDSDTIDYGCEYYAYKFDDLARITHQIQTEFKCANCKQQYERRWCKTDNATCYFCTHFLPMRDTYTSILKDMDWWYLKSGETSRPRFYGAFLDNLKKWSDRFHVFPSAMDIKTIEELRTVRDWTRNEPDTDYWY